MLASTVYPRPKNLPIVRALAGDSTITRALPPVLDFVFDCLAIYITLRKTDGPAQFGRFVLKHVRF